MALLPAPQGIPGWLPCVQPALPNLPAVLNPLQQGPPAGGWCSPPPLPLFLCPSCPALPLLPLLPSWIPFWFSAYSLPVSLPASSFLKPVIQDIDLDFPLLHVPQLPASLAPPRNLVFKSFDAPMSSPKGLPCMRPSFCCRSKNPKHT